MKDKQVKITYPEDGGYETKTIPELIKMKFLDKSKLVMLDKLLTQALMLKNDNDPLLAAEEYVNLSIDYGYENLKRAGFPERRAFIIYNAGLLHFFMELMLMEENLSFQNDLLEMIKELI